DFEEAILLRHLAALSPQMMNLERIAAEPDAPRSWREGVGRDARALRAACTAAPASAGVGLPEPWADSNPPLVGRFGRLLQHWSEMVRCAVEMRREGRTLGRPL